MCVERIIPAPYHPCMRAAPLIACGGLALGLGVASTTAQETYVLTEEDAWETSAVPDPATPEGQLAVARRALTEGDAERAEHLAGAWIDRYEQHPSLPDAYLIRADALLAQRSYYKALFDYEYLIRGFPGSEAFVTGLQREYDIAVLFARGTKRKLLGMRIIDASDEGEELLIRIQERLPGSRLAEQAAIELGDFYFRRREMDLAVEMYSIFIENFPDSRQISKARRLLIYAHLATFKGPKFDVSGLRDARTRLIELQVLEPATAQRIGADGLLTRINESEAVRLLQIAKWYLRTNDPISAELTIRRLLENYHNSIAATEALRLMDTVWPRLPDSIKEQAPDYDLLRRALLGATSAEDRESQFGGAGSNDS